MKICARLVMFALFALAAVPASAWCDPPLVRWNGGGLVCYPEGTDPNCCKSFGNGVQCPGGFHYPYTYCPAEVDGNSGGGPGGPIDPPSFAESTDRQPAQRICIQGDSVQVAGRDIPFADLEAIVAEAFRGPDLLAKAGPGGPQNQDPPCNPDDGSCGTAGGDCHTETQPSSLFPNRNLCRTVCRMTYWTVDEITGMFVPVTYSVYGQWHYC